MPSAQLTITTHPLCQLFSEVSTTTSLVKAFTGESNVNFHEYKNNIAIIVKAAK